MRYAGAKTGRSEVERALRVVSRKDAKIAKGRRSIRYKARTIAHHWSIDSERARPVDAGREYDCIVNQVIHAAARS
jgi:hypothetical protein